MNTCFNCGVRYYQSEQDPHDGFCSNKCKEEDDARLVEGNGIIEAAEKQEVGFTDINKLKLDVHAPAAAQSMKNMLGFNRTITGIDQILKQKGLDHNENEPDDAA